AQIAFFFFFQAEDGIRDRNVTGVQTCALPISKPRRCTGRSPALILVPPPGAARFSWAATCRCTASASARCGSPARAFGASPATRSEERRVGRECRARWAARHEREKDEGTVWHK